MITPYAKNQAQGVIDVIEQMRHPAEARLFLTEMIRDLGGTANARSMPMELATLYALVLLVRAA